MAGLDRIDLTHVVHAEAKKIREFARGFDFRLVGGLALSEHSRRVQCHAVGSGDQLRGTKKYGGPVVPGSPGPCFPCRPGSLHGLPEFLRARLVVGGEHCAMFMGNSNFPSLPVRISFRRSREEFQDAESAAPSVNDAGLPAPGALRVGKDRFVFRRRNDNNSVHEISDLPIFSYRHTLSPKECNVGNRVREG